MMSLYEMIKEYGSGNGEQTMWESVKKISCYLEKHKDELDDYDSLMRDVYAIMCGCHYNEELAEEKIGEMYYEDASGEAHYAPYWTDDEMHQTYESVKRLLPSEYNEWDFRVTLNMLMSDYHNLLESWFGTSAKDKAVEMAVSYLNDPDAPDCNCKIWRNFNK